jgi:hypothetical protein
MAVSTHSHGTPEAGLEGEVRIQLSLGRRERAIAMLGGEGVLSDYVQGGSPIDIRVGALEEALFSGNPTQALMGARAVLATSPTLPFLWWMAKSLEGRALLDLEFYDEAMQSVDPMTMRTQRNQFWYFDELLTLAWVHLFRGEIREVRRTVVPRLLLCQLPGFGAWFQGQGNFLLGLTTEDPVARRLHFLQAVEGFESAGRAAVFASSWKAENLYFGAVAAYEASGRCDPSSLARCKILLSAPDWAGEMFEPIREALNFQLLFFRGSELPEASGKVARRYLANLESPTVDMPRP